ncbi:nucleolar protein 14, partial [Lecanoromycetidae sp. Uapishka_2]
MPPSQLKRLKASLREQGVVGPQRSKKQKKQASKIGALKESRIQRNAALEGIREQFNPFEVKAPSRKKYEFASNRVAAGRVEKGSVSRPGVTKGLGEQNRRKTLLVEMQRRKKVGGIMDRRFGENDPTMTPEEKALERFVREKQRGSKKESLFDLEDAEEDGQLTHFGRSLSFDTPGGVDDFNEADLRGSDEESHDAFHEGRPHKRRRLSDSDSTSSASVDVRVDERPEWPKSKKEVMEEVIAKSKLHKYERQQAKEDDDDLRAELDKGLPDLFALMRGSPRQPPPPVATPSPNAGMNPDRMALLNGKDRSQADMEYDQRLRQMAMEQRAKPTVRTLTAEEQLQQEAQRLKKLEEKRLRRMEGEPEDSASDADKETSALDGDEDPQQDNSEDLGLGSGLTGEPQNREIGVEDEDDFLIEDGLIASDSDPNVSAADESEASVAESSNDDDQDFVRGLLSERDAGREGFSFSKDQSDISEARDTNRGLAYTYICPETEEELLSITQSIPIENVPTVVQRIRALYHPKLAAENKEKLGRFAAILVGYLPYLANQDKRPPFIVLEALIRHIHSLAKTFPEETGRAFRSHLEAIHEERPTTPTSGDLMIFTAIASIFPTSDHFHQVVTPAMLSMTRYLEQRIPRTLGDLATGTYICTICLQYQRLSKRYIPEAVNYILNTLSALSPTKIKHLRTSFPHHVLPDSIRLQDLSAVVIGNRQLDFWDTTAGLDESSNPSLKITLTQTTLDLIDNMVDLWVDKSAFCEVFNPIYVVLRFLASKDCSQKLNESLKVKIRKTSSNVHKHLLQSFAARKPLRLHNHKPLAIKTSIPKFEESYNPDKHYDPDRDRAETSKLKAEHKRERKGALRELRKDANFIARESLREKKERDSAYEKKYKRLVAEIQGEEGREAKNYEREKRMRKSKR